MKTTHPLITQVRKEQTEIELHRLKDEAQIWCDFRKGKDKLHQYKTQLEAIGTLLSNAVAYLQVELDKLDIQKSPGEFYEDCRLFDLRVIWLRKVLKFYKDKFDQRDDDQLKPLLLAADEVVWSCYHQVFERASLYAPEIKQGPAPLPFIESSYSPESFPSELIPYDLKPSEAGFLKTLMSKLPIPLVSLPQSCLRAPWWLVYIGHEVGHHIQYALADKQQFVKLFQAQIEDAVRSNNGVADDVDKWGRWSKEIFADVFSVLAMGQWAVWAMVEFEMQKPGAMLLRRAQYPSPAVRLYLLAHTANSLGLDGTTALRGLDLAGMVKGNLQAERDYSFVPQVVKKALETLPAANATLERLAGFRKEDFLPGGDVPGWSVALRAPDPSASAISALRAPRLIASATLAAWAEIVTGDAMKRKELRRNLAAQALDLIVRSRETDDRGDMSEEVDTTDFGVELAKQLLNANQQQLEI